MKTLGKPITKEFFTTEVGYAMVEDHWRQACRGLSPAHYLFYQLIRGKDYRKAFSTDTSLWAARRALRQQATAIEALFAPYVAPGVTWTLLRYMAVPWQPDPYSVEDG